MAYQGLPTHTTLITGDCTIFCEPQIGIGRGRVNPMGCRVGYSGVGVRVEVCPPCEDPHPRLGYPGYSGYWTVHAMPVHAQIGSAYSESPTFNPPTCPGSPVSLRHHLVLAPLVIPIVMMGYVLGLQMPESGCLRLTQSDQCHRTAHGVAPSPHSLPCPHLVTLFSVVMDS